MKFLTILMILIICLIGIVGFFWLRITLLEESVTSGEFDEEFFKKNANFIFLDCPNCSTNLTNLQDCADFLDESYKNNPLLIEIVKKYNFKEVTKMVKGVVTNLKETKVTCYYYK